MAEREMSDNWNSSVTAPKALSTEISDALSKQIATGALRVGDRLPSEAELSQRFDCSRATVREALKRLAARGLLQTKRGNAGGAFVKCLTFEDAAKTQAETTALVLSMNQTPFAEALAACIALQSGCADLVAAAHDTADMKALSAAVDHMARAHEAAAYARAHIAFHQTYVAASRNAPLIYHVTGAVSALKTGLRALPLEASNLAPITALHRRIANAILACDAGEIRHALATLQATLTAHAAPPTRALDGATATP